MQTGAEPTGHAGVLHLLVVPQLKNGIPLWVHFRKDKPLRRLLRKRREGDQRPRVADLQEEPELIAVI